MSCEHKTSYVSSPTSINCRYLTEPSFVGLYVCIEVSFCTSRSLLRKMTYEDQTSYVSSPPSIIRRSWTEHKVTQIHLCASKFCCAHLGLFCVRLKCTCKTDLCATKRDLDTWTESNTDPFVCIRVSLCTSRSLLRIRITRSLFVAHRSLLYVQSNTDPFVCIQVLLCTSRFLLCVHVSRSLFVAHRSLLHVHLSLFLI